MTHKNLDEAFESFYKMVAVPTCSSSDEPIELDRITGMAFVAGAISTYGFLQEASLIKNVAAATERVREIRKEIDEMAQQMLGIETRSNEEILRDTHTGGNA